MARKEKQKKNQKKTAAAAAATVKKNIKTYEIKDIEICEINKDCGASGGALNRAKIVISIELDEFKNSFCVAF